MTTPKTDNRKKITVSLISLNADLSYTASYYDPERGEQITLLQNGDVQIGELRAGERAKSFLFGVAMPSITIEYDPDLKKDTINDRSMRQEAFWRKCPLVKLAVGTNSNMAKAELLLVDHNQVRDNKYDVIEKQHKIATRVIEASPDDRRKMATFYGSPNVYRMSDKDVLVDLIDYTSGRLMNPNNMIGYGQGKISYMDHFLEKYGDDDFSVNVSVNARKAIEYGFIQVKNDTGRPGNETWLINNMPVGKNEEQVVSYLVQNPEFYELYIMERIRAHEEKSAIASADKIPGQRGGDLRSNNATKEERYRSLGKALKIPAYNNKRLDKLIPEIEAAVSGIDPENITPEIRDYIDEIAAAKAKSAQQPPAVEQ